MGLPPVITAKRGARRVALVVVSCLTLLATPASATLFYPNAQTLSPAGQPPFFPQVALDGSGRATITWSRSDGVAGRIESVRLAANGTPGVVQTLSPSPGGSAARNAFAPQVAIDGSDRARIVWYRYDGSNDRIQSVRLAADGTPGAVQNLSGAGLSAIRPQVAVDASGRATVTWQRSDGINTRIQSVRLAADGTPGPVHTLSAFGQDAVDPQVAIDSTGRATITWERSDGSNQRIQSTRLNVDGTPGPFYYILSGAGQDAIEPQVAIDGSDRATITWQRSDGSNNRIQSVRLAADGSPEAVKTLSGAGEDAGDPQVAIDGSDRATVVWNRSDGSNQRVQSVRLGADGSPQAVKTLSEAGQSAFSPQVAIDGSDRATVVWNRSDGSNQRVQSVRLGANGSPQAVKTLSAAGQSANMSQVAIDGSNRPTVVWRRNDVSFGRVQSTRANITYPETTITSGPSGPTKKDSPSFEFIDALPTTTYECSLDSGSWSACSSPKSYPNLADGPHGFAVRSVDLEGDADPSPAESSFTVDTKLKGSASAKGKQKQKGSKIVIKAKAKAREDLDAKATGKVKLANKSFKLRRKAKGVESGESKTLKLKPKKSKDAKRIARALKQGEKAKAKLKVKLIDGVGNKKTERLSVKLKR